MAMNLGSFASRVVATKVVATDGTGDFTDIQSAIDALPSGGGVVYIKEGTYTITSTITREIDNVYLVGAGFATIITTGSNINLIKVFGDKWTIQNLRIDGNSQATNKGIFCEFVDNIMINNCFIANCGGAGIYFEGSNEYCIISNNNLSYNVGHQIVLDLAQHSIVVGNILADGSADGILLQNAVNHNTITGNIIVSNGGTGINILSGCTNNIVLGNIASGNSTAQITDLGTGTVVANNVTT